jgi:hypothetical protein
MIIINNKNLDRFILEEVIICYFFSISTIIRSVEDVRPIIIGNTFTMMKTTESNYENFMMTRMIS